MLRQQFEEDEQEASLKPPPPPPHVQEIQEMEEDEDMWAIVREMEEQEASINKSAPGLAPVHEGSDDDLYVNE